MNKFSNDMVLSDEPKASYFANAHSADTVNIYWIDLFCGAGGTSTGIHLAGQKVVACVNHDANAIYAHAANHPETKHFTEDIRDFHVVEKLRAIVQELRDSDPGCIIAIWASLECTNFSKAKGGLPRDADSRTLAEHMFMYLRELRPEYFWVENVREFMAWGPLDEKGRPASRKAGTDYLKWVEDVRAFGFRFDYKIMNSANYGAFQSRERLFLQFAARDLPISWPEQTHTKDKRGGDLFGMEKWKAVRDVLNLDHHGKSIFDRKKPLSENTLKRIYAGLIKFVAKGDVSFISKYFSGRPEGKVISIDGPAGTVTVAGGQTLISAEFLQSYYGNGGAHSTDEPSPTLTTKDRLGKVDVHFIDQQYGNSKPAGVDVPAATITQNPKLALVNTQFIMNQFSGGGQHTNLDGPSSTVTSVPKQNLITPEAYIVNANSSASPPLNIDNPAPSITSRTHLLINPSWGGNPGSVDEPSCTIIARQDKAPLYLIAAEHGPVSVLVYDDDCETMVKIKIFTVAYGITDIKMRMLMIDELLRIQGFPPGYKLKGNQTEQKKQIGNAVEVYQSTAIAKAFKQSIEDYFRRAVA